MGRRCCSGSSTASGSRQRRHDDGTGAAEEVALSKEDAGTLQGIQFYLGLDALGHHVDAEPGCKAEDGVDNGLGGRIVREGGGDGAAELDAVEAEAGQPGEAAVEGAEIIEGEADTVGLEALQGPQGFGVVVEQEVLGDFEVEAVRR